VFLKDGDSKKRVVDGTLLTPEEESAFLLLYAERSEACPSQVRDYLFKGGWKGLVMVRDYLYKGGRMVFGVNG
jgi:hypothetical protein